LEFLPSPTQLPEVLHALPAVLQVLQVLLQLPLYQMYLLLVVL
jgi:hypothetical protein